MERCRGSAIVLSMLLLIILSALGMYVVSAPMGARKGASAHHRAAVARNMARAGVNAAIARFRLGHPGGSSYVRLIPAGENLTGRYSVTTRKVVTGAGAGPATGFEEYELVSAGSVAGDAEGNVIVVARVRFGPDQRSMRARIVRWEETEPR